MPARVGCDNSVDVPMFRRIGPPESSAACSEAVVTLPALPLPSTTGAESGGAAGATQSNTA